MFGRLTLIQLLYQFHFHCAKGLQEFIFSDLFANWIAWFSFTGKTDKPNKSFFNQCSESFKEQQKKSCFFSRQKQARTTNLMQIRSQWRIPRVEYYYLFVFHIGYCSLSFFKSSFSSPPRPEQSHSRLWCVCPV